MEAESNRPFVGGDFQTWFIESLCIKFEGLDSLFKGVNISFKSILACCAGSNCDEGLLIPVFRVKSSSLSLHGTILISILGALT